MNSRFVVKIATVTCSALLGASLLSGCMQMQNQSAESEAQEANRTYMSQVNTLMGELEGPLSDFAAAVSDGDVVTMKAKAAVVEQKLEGLSKLEAPEAVADLKTGYEEGCTKLNQALKDYIQLYSEIKAATDKHPFDYSKLAERLSAIQKEYDEGMAALQAADKAAVEKK